MPQSIRRFAAFRLAVLGSLLGLTLVSSSSAEVVLGGRDVNGNLDNSGKNLNPAPNGLGQYVGSLGIGSGVAISDRYLLTASHVGSSTFTVNGSTYNVGFVSSEGALAVYKILDPTKSFSAFAPVATGPTAADNALVTIGFGLGRGLEVDTPGTTKLAGWDWNYTPDGKQGWGTNTVASIVNGSTVGESSASNFLTFNFDRKIDPITGQLQNPDQAILSGGDSGGAVFIKDSVTGQYKLAGINDAVSDLYDANGHYVDAIFDARGFYTNANHTGLVTGPLAVPMTSYAVDLSSQQAYLAPFLFRAVPEPGSLALLAAGLGLTAFRWRRSRLESI